MGKAPCNAIKRQAQHKQLVGKSGRLGRLPEADAKQVGSGNTKEYRRFSRQLSAANVDFIASKNGIDQREFYA